MSSRRPFTIRFSSDLPAEPGDDAVLVELEQAARLLTAQGYTVVLDDGDLWRRCLGRPEWLAQLAGRVQNAIDAREAETRLRRERAQ